MAWTCYSCGTKNPNDADTCRKCGGTVAAPRSFYIQWVFGGAIFFLVTYLLGAFVGGTLVEFAAAAEDAEIFAEAQAAGVEGESTASMDPTEVKKARARVIAKKKAEMSPVLRNLIYWFLPFLLFVVCGAIVGFVSDGKTVLEAGFGSLVGQAGGFLLLVYAFGTEVGWIAFGIGMVVGFGLAILGSWIGEIIQDRHERAGAM